MAAEAPARDDQIERVRVALEGLAPDQAERLVRIVELGAMICLVEDATAARAFCGASFVTSASVRSDRRGRRNGRTREHAGTT